MEDGLAAAPAPQFGLPQLRWPEWRAC